MTRVGTGNYCINVPGISVANTPIVATTDQSSSGATAPGTTNWVDNVNPMQGTPSRHTQVQYDGTPESCPAGEFEIETFRMFLDPNTDSGSMHEFFDAGFSFVVP